MIGGIPMYCKNCGEALEDNQAICVKCGVKVGDGNKYCPNCAAQTNPEQEVCLSCGVSLKKTSSIVDGTIGGQSKLVMAIICFFLGAIGIHNFMFGETKKGIVKIILCFCFGISTILMLIDFVKILTDKYEIDPEKFF